MKAKALSTILGGILIHMTLGTIYTASNMMTYVISFLHVVKGYTNIDSSYASWTFATQSLGQGICVAVGGVIQRYLGIKPAIILGSLLLSLSTLGAYFTVNNFYLFVATYGLVFGLGIGIAYSSPMTAAMKWFPKNRGMANGFIVLGFGLGSFVFNFVQTWFINPHNVKPELDPTGATTDKFFPAAVVEHLPRVFLYLGGIYLIIQIIGVFLIFEPNEDEQKELDVTLVTDSEALLPSEKNEGMTTSQIFAIPKFWQIWFTMLCITMSNIFVSSFYKFIGQSFITDDLFLVIVGSLSSICNGVFRPVWGYINDKKGYKLAMGCMLILFALFVGTISFTKYGGSIMYLVWVCSIYACVGGAFALVPTYTDHCFGSLCFGSNYGMVFTSVIISSIISAFFLTSMIKRIGVIGISIILASLILLGLLITLIPKNWTYKEYQPKNDVPPNPEQEGEKAE